MDDMVLLYYVATDKWVIMDRRQNNNRPFDGWHMATWGTTEQCTRKKNSLMKRRQKYGSAEAFLHSIQR